MDKKRRVLIADDEDVNREFFDIMLGNLGFVVDKAEDGEKTLEFIKKNNPDIIIIDDMLPVISGWQVTKTLKNDPSYQKYSDIPVIMLSKMVDTEAIVEGFELGVDDYIRKPFSFAVVYARIKAALRNREMMYKKAQHEEVIALVKSLSNTLLFLSEHLVTPVAALKNAVNDFGSEKCMEKEVFVKLITENTDIILATIASLSEQITEIRKTEGNIEYTTLDLLELEKKYKSHLKKMKSKGGL